MSNIGNWIRRYHECGGSAPTLVCFPHAGGSASYFFRFSARLAPRVQVLAVQYPGRLDRYREPLVDDLHELAELVVEGMDGVVPAGAALFGHSMGATLAYEVARRLDPPPAALVASGRQAPQCQQDKTGPVLDDEVLLADMRLLSGTSSAVLEQEELMRAALPILRNDYRAIGRYRPVADGQVDCDVHAVVGDADPKVTRAEAESWAKHTTGGFALTVLPGGHFYLDQQLDRVAGIVRDALGVR